MPRNELPPEFDTSLQFNQEMFGGKLRACTKSIFCADAWRSAKEAIAKKAEVSLETVREQALPLTGTPDHPVNLGNFNLKGTGEAYRALIHNNTLVVINNHADTVKPV